MPNNQVSPGVRGTENDQATTSPADATDVGAFAGMFQWGPVEERTLITSNARNRNRSLEQRFGKPKRNFNQESWFAAASYLDYSRVLYVSRGIAPGTRNAIGGYGVGNAVDLGTWSGTFGAIGASPAAGDFHISGQIISLAKNNSTATDREDELETLVAGSTIELTISDGTNQETITAKVSSVSISADAVNVTVEESITLAVTSPTSADVSVMYEFTYDQYRDITKHTAADGITNVVIKNFANFEDSKAAIDDRVKFASRWPGRLGNSIEVHVCDNKFAWGYDSSELGSDSYWIEVGTGDQTTGDVYGSATAPTSGATTLLTGDIFPADLVVGRTFVVNDKSVTLATVDSVAGTVTFASTNFGNSVIARFAATTPDWVYRNSLEAEVPAQSRTVENAKDEDGVGFSVEDELHIVVTDRFGEFTGVERQIVERYPSLSRYIEAKDDTGGTLFYKDVVNRRSQYIWAVNDIEAAGEDGYTSDEIEDLADVSDVASSNKVFPMVGGHDGYNEEDYATAGATATKADENSVSLTGITAAWDVFRGGIEIDFLIAGKAQNGERAHAIQNQLRSIRSERGDDCVGCLSPPRSAVVNNPGNEVEAIIDWAGGIQSDSYMVLDSGYKLMYDRYNDVNIYVPLNGDIAGLMAATNAPWFSPAGRVKGQIKNASGLSYNPDARGDRDRLYVNRVNPVLSQPGRGIYLYGDKTALSRNSSFNRINVRRLFITLRKIITDISEDAALFDNNDPVTRARFVNTVEPELRSIQGGRGISDFYLQCDGQNNPNDVEDDNQFVADIYVKPRRSINYINLNFVSVRTGAQFSEIAR